MNKAQLIAKIEKETGESLAAIERVLNTFVHLTKVELKAGRVVKLVGFGTFKTIKRKSRNGRNPQTGETLFIKAHNSPKFTAGQELKDLVK